MMKLVFIVCMVGQPDHCEEKSLEFFQMASEHACMVRAQPQLAQWATTHPNWLVKRWTCQNGEHVRTRA